MASRRVIILGSTGSIGTQTLDVIEHLNALHERGRWPQRYDVVGLAAGANADLIAEQANVFGVGAVALASESAPEVSGARVITGPNASERLVREVEADVVVAAIVGFAGLDATLAAVELGREVVLANKETLVAAGSLVVPAARRSGARLLPVDSEHSALWQCLQELGLHEPPAISEPIAPPMDATGSIARLILTASGGPFRTSSRETIRHATPEQALAHPTWSMGRKVSIDSASLMNKGLEVIEAHWLFGLPGDRIDAVIHPQSIVHSMVEFEDGSVIAQLGTPDMRTPIQYALTWPARIDGRSPRLRASELTRLDFEPPDLERFPSLGLAYDVIEAGGTAGAVLNAANEVAVEAFLAERVEFGRIPELVGEALSRVGVTPIGSLEDVRRADAAARRVVADRLAARVS
ncbi:MAG: 1-deoxy-D-xylulose-5-phosphate reductoisomerase [Planctomycetota bacterium]